MREGPIVGREHHEHATAVRYYADLSSFPGLTASRPKVVYFRRSCSVSHIAIAIV
jgi:hypothetical protein